jgi:hypothetical protein
LAPSPSGGQFQRPCPRRNPAEDVRSYTPR